MDTCILENRTKMVIQYPCCHLSLNQKMLWTSPNHLKPNTECQKGDYKLDLSGARNTSQLMTILARPSPLGS